MVRNEALESDGAMFNPVPLPIEAAILPSRPTPRNHLLRSSKVRTRSLHLQTRGHDDGEVS